VSTTPTPTGTLSSITWDLPYGEPLSLDYIKADYYSPQTIDANLCDQLYWTNPVTQTPEPDLATSMSHPNPLTLIYTIRQGVHFWDGHLLTATDVAYSLNRNLNPKLGSGQALFYRNVKSITATGPFQVTVKLIRPDIVFPEELASNSGFVAEAAFMKKEGSAFGNPKVGIMCSGPYEFESWTPGNQIVIKANPNYWNKALEPKVQTVKFDFITSTSALTAGLLSGGIDGTYEVPQSSIPELESTSVGHLYFGASSQVDVMLPLAGPMANPLIRKALSLVIDRAAIAKTVFGGAAQPGLSLVPPDVFAYDASSFQAAYNKLPGASSDVAEAKALIRQAGSPKTPITFGYLAGDQQQLETGTILQSNADAAGLTMTLKPLTSAQYGNITTGVSSPPGIDLAIYAGYNLVREPLEEPPYFITPRPLGYTNYIGYSNRTVTNDLNLATETQNTQKRAQLYIAAQAIYQGQDTAVIPLVNLNEVSFGNSKLTGFPTQFAYFEYPWAAMLGAAH
jgi:peptide/nickel transport system substrate-binding protein